MLPLLPFLTVAAANLQKLGKRGASLPVQGVARDMALAARRPGQIMI